MKLIEFLIKLLIIGILLVFSNVYVLDYSQDIGAYQGNLLSIQQYQEAYSFTFQKDLYYSFIVIPLMDFFSENSSILIVLRLINILLILIAIRFWKSAIIPLILSVLVLLYTTHLSMNHMEYLRQGLSIGIFLCATNFNSWRYKLPFIFISILLHNAALFCILPYLLINSFRIDLLGMFTNKKYMWITVVLPLFVLISGIVLSRFELFNFIDAQFLSSARSNVFAYMFLILYYFYIMLFYNQTKNKSYNNVLYLLLIFMFIYPILTDFGRLLSIVLVIHWFVVEKNKFRLSSILDLCIIGVISLVI